MSQDAGMRARVDGKARTQVSLVWSLTVGPISVRCLPNGRGTFVVQARAGGRWDTEIATGPDAAQLLANYVATVSRLKPEIFKCK